MVVDTGLRQNTCLHSRLLQKPQAPGLAGFGQSGKNRPFWTGLNCPVQNLSITQVTTTTTNSSTTLDGLNEFELCKTHSTTQKTSHRTS